MDYLPSECFFSRSLGGWLHIFKLSTLLRQSYCLLDSKGNWAKKQRNHHSTPLPLSATLTSSLTSGWAQWTVHGRPTISSQHYQFWFLFHLFAFLIKLYVGRIYSIVSYSYRIMSLVGTQFGYNFSNFPEPIRLAFKTVNGKHAWRKYFARFF